MEDKTQFVAAIDVGTTKIVSLLGKRNEKNKIEIVDFTRSESKGIRRGEVLNPEEVSGVIRNVITDLQGKAGIIFSEVFVGIAGEHIRIVRDRKGLNRPSYDVSITAAEVEELKFEARNIALDEGRQILKVLPMSYIVDSETNIANPIGMLGRRLEANFNIVVGNIDSIKRIERSVDMSDLTLRDIILEPMASAEAVLYDDEREVGVVLVDIGGGTTDIAVFYDNKLRHLAVLPYGGNVITKDIKEGCELIERVAEELKVLHGVALVEAVVEDKTIVIPAKIRGREPKEISMRNLANIIQARMDEIIDGIMFEIDKSGYADKLGCGIVITGGGATLRYVDQLFRFRTGKEVRIGYPGEHLDGKSEKINEPCYATGVGLLMKGFEYMDERFEQMKVSFPENIEIEQEEPKIDIVEQLPKESKKTNFKVLIDKFADSFSGFFVEPESKM